MPINIFVNLLKLRDVKMSDLLKDMAFTIENDDVVYELANLKLCPQWEQLNPNVVVISNSDDHGWLKWCFLEWHTGSMGGKENWYKPFLYGEGPSGNLRECRHSYIGEEGYVFYLNKVNMIDALNWLAKYYDMD